MSSQSILSRNRCRAALTAAIAGFVFSLQGLSLSTFACLPQDTIRSIVADDFTKHRPAGNAQARRRRSQSDAAAKRRYRLASPPGKSAAVRFSVSASSQLGLTVWRLRPRLIADRSAPTRTWTVARVEADTRFREGDYVRLSIECPRAGYLYVIDRDWFTDEQASETKLIFPIRGEDNRLHAGRVITIPGEDQFPFKASPKRNQTGELLTILVTSSPIPLTLSNDPLPISAARLSEWERLWGAATERFELDGGAGQARTTTEEQASSSNQTRQLTRDDPAPQTIYLISPINDDGFLFQVKLYYTD